MEAQVCLIGLKCVYTVYMYWQSTRAAVSPQSDCLTFLSVVALMKQVESL